MSNSKKTIENNSRRNFLYQSSLASLGLVFMGKNALAANSFFLAKLNSKINGVQIGAITYSFRSMPGSAEQIIQYCKEAGISAVELMGDPAEAYAGSPAGLMTEVSRENFMKVMEERNAKARTWRETASMDKFVELRKLFNDAGITIYAYKPDAALGVKSTDGEIDYAMRAAKALGATSVNVEIPTNADHSKRLGEFGLKHKVYVGYHAHTQATDTVWDLALSQSPYNAINLDCGHYIAAGGANTTATLLAFIEKNHDRISSMHIKDRKNKVNGSKNMPWGEGDTPLKEILTLLKTKKYKIPASIELEYDIPAGSDAVKETKKCFEYAKAILEA
ncbi:MAG: sugar phosphate isomerase/epimerase [Sediminibacterium sp.]|nr:sugar phosphate isomerase/epimerase [Sediminibacterium sp.]